MRQPIGYMLTWTTYGSWLQGDKRGYVKDGTIMPENIALNRANRMVMTSPQMSLTFRQKKIIEKELRKEADLLGQEIYAISVGKNHIHLIVGSNDLDAASATSHYKNAARLAVQADGFCGRLWTRGFSKRYCFDQAQLNTMIEYVNRHNK
jgi:REP element-mobilizing transposase RayT